MATIKDVARLARVSPACVSLVLNNKSYVSQKTKQRICKAIKQLNYRPNIIARSLRKKETNSIGLVISDISNPFFPEVARGVEDAARKYGLSLVLCNTNADQSLERKHIDVLLAKQIDGLILTSARSESHLEQYIKENCYLVLVNRELLPGRLDFVGIDNLASAKMAVDHLIKLGHRRIAFIRGEPASSASFRRYEGYKLALEQAKMSYTDNFVKTGYLRYAGGYQAMESLLQARPYPTAVFCANDMMALAAIDVCLLKGIRIPQDLAIVGFDDIWVASLRNIQLTTVHQPRYLMGAKSVDLLIEIITGKRTQAKRVILPTKLVVRETCGASL